MGAGSPWSIWHPCLIGLLEADWVLAGSAQDFHSKSPGDYLCRRVVGIGDLMV